MSEKEYIEREAMIENIKRVCCTDCNSYGGVRCRACGTGDALDMIEDAPTADVVEVVRCKDCVCGRPTNKSDRFEALYPLEYLYCCVHECGVKKDGYCSYGKRKEQT